MFSDGYVDQMGGEKGRKFLSSNFRKLLAAIHQKPIEEQKAAIEKTYDDWTAGFEQTDDVLVMGIKI